MNGIFFIAGMILIWLSFGDSAVESSDKENLLGPMNDELDEYERFEKKLRHEVENGK